MGSIDQVRAVILYGDHPELTYSLTLSGKDGADADHYQERDVRNALNDLESTEEQDS